MHGWAVCKLTGAGGRGQSLEGLTQVQHFLLGVIWGPAFASEATCIPSQAFHVCVGLTLRLSDVPSLIQLEKMAFNGL
jgi:hypothetical protein